MEVVLAERSKDPGSIVFEFEIVLSGRSELVPDNVEGELVSCGKVSICERSFDFCLTP
jgi:hypothetical protein